MSEYVVWGKLPEEALWEERILHEGIERMTTAQDLKLFCERKGFVNVRIAELDLTKKPDFIGTIAR